MKKIVTVSREFGSGGRELGKRLADALGLSYIDNEIVEAMSKETALDEKYLEERLNSGILQYPVTFAHSFSRIPSASGSAMLIAQQHKIIRETAARTDCVIVGRGADAVLSDMRPFRIFVYADMQSKIARCKARNGESATDKDISREIKRIDKARRITHDLYSSYPWGDKAGYDLMVNTSKCEIKDIAPIIAEYARKYFEGGGL